MSKNNLAFIFCMICLGLSLLATPFAVSWLVGQKVEASSAPLLPCCGEEISDLHKRIERLQGEVRLQTRLKIDAMQAKQPLEELIQELEQELAACRAHVLFNEPYEVTQ